MILLPCFEHAGEFFPSLAANVCIAVGKVLAVYFYVYPKLTDLVKEEELVAIRNALQSTPYDPSHFQFSYTDEKVAKAVKHVLTFFVRDKFEHNMEDYREIRKQTEEYLKEYRNPCVYQTFEFLDMMYSDPIVGFLTVCSTSDDSEWCG